MPLAELHWLIADRDESITVESVKEGIRVYDNPVGVLTNNPPFNEQLFQLNNYMHLSARDPQNLFAAGLPLHTYGRGMGALGLAGDLSSQSRFVRAAFVKMNSVSGNTETESVSQFFHILGAVDQQRGCSWWKMENMKSRFIPPAAMRTEGFIIIPPMITIRLRRWTCIRRSWTAPAWPDIR